MTIQNSLPSIFRSVKPLQWITELEAYFLRHKMSTDYIKIWVASLFVDKDTQDWIDQRYGGFKNINDWETFKVDLVYYFGDYVEECLLLGYDEEYIYSGKPIRGATSMTGENLINEEEPVQEKEVNEVKEQVPIEESIRHEEFGVEVKVSVEVTNPESTLKENQVLNLQLEPSLSLIKEGQDAGDNIVLGITRSDSLIKEKLLKVCNRIIVQICELGSYVSPTQEMLRLLPKSWKFKFKHGVSKREVHNWGRNKRFTCELLFKWTVLLFFGSLLRPPELKHAFMNLEDKVLSRREICCRKSAICFGQGLSLHPTVQLDSDQRLSLKQYHH